MNSFVLAAEGEKRELGNKEKKEGELSSFLVLVFLCFVQLADEREIAARLFQVDRHVAETPSFTSTKELKPSALRQQDSGR